MVIYFNSDGGNTREIVMVEHDVITPTIPKGILDEQINYYNSKGLMFVSIIQEIGGKIFDYNVCINNNNEFVGLQPKEGYNEY